ncbi:MAG: glycosyltransferase family 9 protein [Methylacidiphilales bacterium]|nr:glycosyltransferase family 9 protein [Candidatus Methylacidiphilales bacterium]
MKPVLIRWIDFWLGVPLCVIATALRRMMEVGSNFWGRKNTDRQPRSVVFVQVTEIGAKVLAAPAYAYAAERVGWRNVYVLTFSDSVELLSIMGGVPEENVLALRKKNLFVFGWDLLGALWRLRKLGVEGCVNYEFFSRAGALISWATGARVRAGLHRFTSELPYCGDLFTHRVNYNFSLHTAETFMVLVQALFSKRSEEPFLKERIERKLVPPVFVPTSRDEEEVDELLRSMGAQSHGRRRWIFNPNAGDLLPLRKWPMKHWEELVRLVAERYPDVDFIVTGTASERGAVEDAIRRWPKGRVINLCGLTTLRQLLTLYCRCEVLVTNDSGPGHFASLTGIPVVVLFGPETPALWAPLGDRVRALNLGLACSPCVSVFNHRFSPCRNNVCMQEMQPSFVLGAVESLLAGELKG